MSTVHYDQLSDAYIDGQAVGAAEYDSLVRILDAQVVGALEGLGEGLIEGGEVSAGTGLAVDVTALKAVVDTAKGKCYLATAATVQVSGLTPNTTAYLFAQANLETEGGTDDSRETAVVVFDTETSDTPLLGATLLAKVVTGADAVTSVTDERSYITAVAALAGLTDFQDQIDALEVAVGTDYFGESAPALSVDARLALIEAGGSSGEGPSYWGALAKSPGDSTTVDQAIEQAVAAVEVGGAGEVVTTPADPWDVDSVNQAKALLDRTVTGAIEEATNQVDCLILKWGVFGDGTGSTPDYVDEINSTWLPA